MATVNAGAKVKVVTNNEFATISFNGNSNVNLLEQNIILNTENKITEIPVTILSQQGSTYETVIYIEKVSNNCNLVSVIVNDEEAIKSDTENKLISYIYDTAKSARIKIEAQDELATIVRTTESGDIWIDENGLSIKGQKSLDMTEVTNEEITTICFKIVAENGDESPVYRLDIEKMSSDTALKEIYVEGKLVTLNEEGKYVAYVLDISNAPEVKAVANNSFAAVRIGLCTESIYESTQNVTLSAGKQTTIPITVRSQSGITKVTYLYIIRISTNVNLSLVTIDGKEANEYNEETHTYTFIVGADKTDYELYVLAESDYTQLEFESEKYDSVITTIVNVEKQSLGETFIVTAKSEAGDYVEYKIDIVHESDNVNLDYVKVNNKEVNPDEVNGDTYTVIIPKDEVATLLEVQTEHPYANVRLGDNVSVKHNDKMVLDCNDLSLKQIVIPIVITAADGKRIKTYNVVLIRDNSTYVMGEVLTESHKGIHKSKVTVYKLGKPDEVIAETQTNDDGTYKIRLYTEGKDSPDMLLEKYKLVVTKPGYLSYTVTDIILIPETDIDLGKYKLIAGDIVETGEIEIDDLVWFNRRFGYTIDTQIDDENQIYDFNEDGIIDSIDREILVKNYGKLAEVVIWENPYEIEAVNIEEKEGFMLPLACNYVITSEYGVRKDPISGEEGLHAGIDLRGEHHAQIQSIADGEVVYSGVQNGYGNCVEIRHIIDGEAINSFYAHMSRLDVKVGDKVKKGEIIGLEGGEPGVDKNAGSSTGHHLHFEIRLKSNTKDTKDPREYIKF